MTKIKTLSAPLLALWHEVARAVDAHDSARTNLIAARNGRSNAALSAAFERMKVTHRAKADAELKYIEAVQASETK
jgi:hypothetical protein